MKNGKKLKYEKLIGQYIENDSHLKENVISIYAMGSFVKNEEFNDIDINIFCNENSYMFIRKIKDMQEYFIATHDISIDVNAIDSCMYADGFLFNDMFIHRNRHSLLLFELKTLNYKIYGEDILMDMKFDRHSLKKEALKLALTVRHRLSKKYFMEINHDGHSSFIRKNVKYAIEFFLVFYDVENPYYCTAEEFISSFPQFMEYEKLITIALGRDPNYCVTYENAYDFIVDLSKNMKRAYVA